MLDCQVRIEGSVRKTSRKESEVYFASRPRESQISAWASNQSRAIAGRPMLLGQAEKIRRKYEGRVIPCPPFWGGYLLVPSQIEFWITGKSRLHHRSLYRRRGRRWKYVLLAP